MDNNQVRAVNSRALSAVSRQLDERLTQHPYATLAAAAGVGYVLGGGLFTRLTARLLKVLIAAAAPLALGPLVKTKSAGGPDMARQPTADARLKRRRTAVPGS